jgi:hypothetical protein
VGAAPAGNECQSCDCDEPSDPQPQFDEPFSPSPGLTADGSKTKTPTEEPFEDMTSELPAEETKLCDDSAWDFSDLRALYINCTLKRSPEISNTQGLADVSIAIMERLGVQGDVIRAVEHDIASGVFPDMTAHSWLTDEWPAIFEKVIDADILVLLSPIWLGEKSSICTNVIERLYGNSHLLNSWPMGLLGRPENGDRDPGLGAVPTDQEATASLARRRRRPLAPAPHALAIGRGVRSGPSDRAAAAGRARATGPACHAGDPRRQPRQRPRGP